MIYRPDTSGHGPVNSRHHEISSNNIVAGIVLWMRPANERWRYTVTPSFIGWAHTQNDPCSGCKSIVSVITCSTCNFLKYNRKFKTRVWPLHEPYILSEKQWCRLLKLHVTRHEYVKLNSTHYCQVYGKLTTGTTKPNNMCCIFTHCPTPSHVCTVEAY